VAFILTLSSRTSTMPRPPSSIVKRQFFTEVGSKHDAASHKAVCNDPQCKASYLWTTSTGSLRKHIRMNHRDLYPTLELYESQQASSSGSGVAATSSSFTVSRPTPSSINVSMSLESGLVDASDDRTRSSPGPSRKRHAESVIDMTDADVEEPCSAARPSSTWLAPRNLVAKRVQTTPVTSAPQLPLKQLTFEESLQPEIKATWRGKLAEMFSCHSLPIRLVASQQFIDVLHMFRQCPTAVIPSAYDLAKEQDAAFQKLKIKVVQRMTSANTHVTIAVDGWTNVRHDKVVNIVPLCRGSAYYWTSVVNSYHSNTAVWQYNHLKPHFEDLIRRGVRLVAVVADNESVNGALFALLQEDYPFLVQVPCAAHTIQLAVKKLLCVKSVRKVVKVMSRILRTFRKSKSLRQSLMNVQIAVVGSKNAKGLLRPQDTRWSSFLKAAERLLFLRQFVQMIAPQSEAFWTNLSDLCGLLKPFQVATDIVQSDSSSLFDIYSQFHRLLRHIKSLKPTDAFFSISKQAKNVILTEWNNHVNEDAVICCAAFSFDSTHLQLFDSQKRLAAAEWFLDFGVNYLSFYELTEEKDEMNLRATLRKQHAEFEGREGPFLNMDDIKKDLIRAHARQNTSFISTCKPGTGALPLSVSESSTSQTSSSSPPSSPMPISAPPPAEQHMCFWQPSLVWFRYQTSVPELTACVLALLSITATEAAVERSFSAQGTVHSKKRNRLLNSSVEREMFIKFNLRLLAETPGNRSTPGACVEVNDMHEEVSNSGKRNDSLFTNSESETERASDEDEADQLIRTLIRADGGGSESDSGEEDSEVDGKESEIDVVHEESEINVVQRVDERTCASPIASNQDDGGSRMSSDEEEVNSKGELRPRSKVQIPKLLAASPSVRVRDEASALQSKPPRRIKRVRVKAQLQRVVTVPPVSRPRQKPAESPSLFGPPRSYRGRREETASIATDKDVNNFIECYGATMSITTAWQWNSDKENSLQQAAITYSPPIRTILSTLKVALEQRAQRIAEGEG
jgi:hypothetical protein